jgi:hypothetical protein
MLARSSTMWKVGNVMSVTVMSVTDDGWGFSVTTERGNPVVLFAYETQQAAEAAARQVKACRVARRNLTPGRSQIRA